MINSKIARNCLETRCSETKLDNHKRRNAHRIFERVGQAASHSRDWDKLANSGFLFDTIIIGFFRGTSAPVFRLILYFPILGFIVVFVAPRFGVFV
jgi:hypothetical protein